MGGASVYWSELCKHLLKTSSVDVKMTGSQNSNILYAELEKNYVFKELPYELPIVLERYLPVRSVLGKDNELFHSSYYRTISYPPIKQITTIHDFTYEYFNSGFKKYVHSAQKRFSIHQADGIIAVSENTKKDLVKIYPQFKSKKIKVIYNGALREYYHPLDKAAALKALKVMNRKNDIHPFFLFIGDRKSKYKNFYFAVELLKAMNTHELLIVGEPLTKAENNILRKNFQNYNVLNFVSNTDLNILYNCADALLYPSSYEGFGIPIVEAMMAGCPVLALNQSSIPEIYFDPNFLAKNLTTESFAYTWREIQKNRDYIVTGGVSFSQQFSWNRSMEQHVDFYNEILNGDKI